MKHPDREEWGPYLWGEASPKDQARLSAHLEECAECATEITAWKRTLKRLDSWKFPRKTSTRFQFAPPLRWAAAAALMIGVGFGFSRLTTPAAPNMDELRAQVEASILSKLPSEVQRQVRQEVVPAVAAAQTQITSEFRTQVAETVDQALKGVATVSRREARRQMGEFVRTMDRRREDDRKTLLALVEAVQTQHANDYVTLRRDVETLASMTDEQFQQAQLKLIQLADNSYGPSSGEQ